MKNALGIIFLLHSSVLCLTQSVIEWDKSEEITLTSFQGKLPKLANDQVQQYSFAVTYDFSFQMLGMQFAFTKNFNKYVNAYYDPQLSWIEEGDLTDQLLLMANLDFDLVELYARKFRKKLFETKNVGSNINFFNDIHAEINRKYVDRQSVIQSEIRTRNDVVSYLNSELETVNLEIDELPEFCKSCKPKKMSTQKKDNKE